MHLRVVSDLHLEFGVISLTSLPTDREGILVLAGDICPYVLPKILLSFLTAAANAFAHVIYVFGNHEFYGGGSFKLGREHVRKLLEQHRLTNVHLLENETLAIADIAFIGATLWTDFDKEHPPTMYQTARFINDYQSIVVEENGGRRFLQPTDVLAEHAFSRNYVFATAQKEKSSGRKTVVIVHHGVSARSIHPRFAGSVVNGAFVSDLSQEILSTQPDLVIHGHVHNCFDYMIGNTHVVVNPRGYPNENKQWNEQLVIQI